MWISSVRQHVSSVRLVTAQPERLEGAPLLPEGLKKVRVFSQSRYWSLIPRCLVMLLRVYFTSSLWTSFSRTPLRKRWGRILGQERCLLRMLRVPETPLFPGPLNSCTIHPETESLGPGKMWRCFGGRNCNKMADFVSKPSFVKTFFYSYIFRIIIYLYNIL